MTDRRKKPPARGQLRSFGIIMTAFFALLGCYPLFRHGQPRLWALAAGGAFAGVALLAPGWLRRPYAVWMAFGQALGWLNSRVLLGVTYFLLFAPAAFLMRLAGKDPMRRRFEPQANTYRLARGSRPAAHMDRQF